MSGAAGSSKRILLIGYGNPGRRDDGLGPAVINAFEAAPPKGVTLESDYQLNIEHAAMAAEHDLVLFVDAAETGPAPYELKTIAPAEQIAFTSHSTSPGAVLAMCQEHFERRPEAWVLGVRGYEFAFEEGLSAGAIENLDAAVTCVQDLLRKWKDRGMETSHKKTPTILTIDDDPDVRAALRIVLEAEGFSVGQATSGEEGLKIAERIQPDAVIVDLMMEKVDSGSVLAQKLKESGYKGPVFLLSSAGDTVRYNLDARDLGLAGIFQKPIEPNTLVSLLRSKLQLKHAG